MWSRNHLCRELREPAWGKTRPFAKLPRFRTHKRTPLFSYFFLQVDNKANTRVLRFPVKKEEKILSINFTTSLRFENLISYLSTKNVFWIYEKREQKKKRGFSFRFFFKVGWYFILDKKWKIEKKNVLFIFFKKYLWKW